VAGARVLWRWQRSRDGVLHESLREAVSDAEGRFAFSGHAAVPHRLQVSADGYRPATLMVPATQAEARIRLDLADGL
jgi:hypothetical protein